MRRRGCLSSTPVRCQQSSVIYSKMNGRDSDSEREPMLNERMQSSTKKEPMMVSGDRKCRSNFKPLHLFLLAIVVIVSAILVLLIVTLVTINLMRSELEKVGDQTKSFVVHSISRLRDEMPDPLFSEQKQAWIQQALQNLSALRFPNPFIPPGLSPVRATSGLQGYAIGNMWRPQILQRDFAWHDPNCARHCKKSDFQEAAVLMISLDGFAKYYLEKRASRTLDLIAECGSSAKFMYSSYPSKTFPNHYAMATGLYPESNGIIDNYIHDSELSQNLVSVAETSDPRYFKGEPIWAVAEKSGLRTACLFWIGCWPNVNGRPTYNMKYNQSFSFEERVAKIVEWLTMPVDRRPSLVMAYFDQPDLTGHFRRTDNEVDAEIVRLDLLLDHLLTSLHRNDLLDCVNIIIVSDHGMHKLNKRIYLNEVLNTAGMIVSSGVVSRIELANSITTLPELEDQLRCRNKGTEFRIYDKNHMPRRYHYTSSNRIGDLLLEGQPGVTLFASREDDVGVVADHGYDYLVPTMQAIFYARGPDITPKLLLEPFQNIELFHLLSDLLNLSPETPTNGTHGRLNRIISTPGKATHRTPQPMNVMQCAPRVLLTSPKLSSCDVSCDRMAEELSNWMVGCLIGAPVSLIGFSDPSLRYCYIPLCSVTVIMATATRDESPVAVYEPLLSMDVVKDNSLENCTMVHDQYAVDCNTWDQKKDLHTSSGLNYYELLAHSHNGFSHVDLTKALLYDVFTRGHFAQLQNLTKHYAKKYRRLVAITGTIFDFNNDGLADSADMRRSAETGRNDWPSHIFRILIRCADGLWTADGHMCQEPLETRVLTFILPNLPDDLNCLTSMEYLRVNTARIRDVELLTGLRFFTDRSFYDDNITIQLRTDIAQELWEL